MNKIEDLEKKINSELTTKIKESKILHNQLYLSINSEDLLDVILLLKTNKDTKYKQTGFVMDFYDIDTIFNKYIHSKIDHKILNDVEGLNNPTSEQLSKWIWDNLKTELGSLYKLVLWENETSRVEYSRN